MGARQTLAFPGASTAAVQPRGMMIRAMAMCHLLYVNRCAAAWKEEDCVGSIPHIACRRDAYFACEQAANKALETTTVTDLNVLTKEALNTDYIST